MAGAVRNPDALASLHTALVDSRNGYQEALEDSGPRGFDGIFRDMIDVRTRDSEELAAVLASLGRSPDPDGSFMSTVHRTVIRVRSLFTELDESIIPGLIDGEERILGYYDEAIAEAAGARHESTLQQQRRRLLQKIQRMRELKPTSRRE